MKISELSGLLDRDFIRLTKEIESFRSESNLWRIEGEILNSAGNLCVHLCGNLRHFIGHIAGGTNYERDRPYEFAVKDLSKKELLNLIAETSTEILDVLSKLSEEDAEKDYPIEVFGYPMTFGYFFIHLYGHFNYHLGQINYARRLLDE